LLNSVCEPGPITDRPETTVGQQAGLERHQILKVLRVADLSRDAVYLRLRFAGSFESQGAYTFGA
jgi:hypothetical protein